MNLTELKVWIEGFNNGLQKDRPPNNEQWKALLDAVAKAADDPQPIPIVPQDIYPSNGIIVDSRQYYVGSNTGQYTVDDYKINKSRPDRDSFYDTTMICEGGSDSE